MTATELEKKRNDLESRFTALTKKRDAVKQQLEKLAADLAALYEELPVELRKQIEAIEASNRELCERDAACKSTTSRPQPRCCIEAHRQDPNHYRRSRSAS
ncbi:MAG: hypothetical protein ABFD89_16875 [Bryobacteraceae bacterium]